MKLLRLIYVIKKTGLSRAQLYKLMKEGRFPSNVLISERAVAWVESEVEEWMKSRLENRYVVEGVDTNKDQKCL